MTPQQKTAIAAKLGVALHTQTDESLIKLCLLHRAAPDALNTFPAALKAEIERRYTPQKIQQADVTYSVLQNFANQFQSAVPFAHLRLQEMAASVNRDIWFTDNREWFRDAINNADIAQWLATESSILEKCLNNRLALTMLAQSTTAATAILSHEDAAALWKNATALWDIWPQHAEGMAVLAKSSTLVRYAMDLPAARNALLASVTAVNALLASATAIRTLVASQNDVTAIAASETAMPLVAASTDMMDALAASETAIGIIIASPAAFQHVANSAVAMAVVAASQTVMTAIAASSAAMTALNAADTAIHVVTGSAQALATLLKNRAHLGILDTKLAAAHERIIASVSQSPLFSRSTVRSNGDSSQRFFHIGLNTPTFYLVTSVDLYYATVSISNGINNRTVLSAGSSDRITRENLKALAIGGVRITYGTNNNSHSVNFDVYTVVV